MEGFPEGRRGRVLRPNLTLTTRAVGPGYQSAVSLVAWARKTGQNSGLTKMIFISAFISDVGQSLIQAFGEQAPEWYIRDFCNLSSLVVLLLSYRFTDRENRKPVAL